MPGLNEKRLLLHKHLKYSLVLDVITIIILFAFSLFIKYLLGTLIYNYFGIYFRYGHITQDGRTIYIDLEKYSDADYYYKIYLEAFRTGTWNPYDRYPNTPLDYYMYGPFLIYGMWIISLFVFKINSSADLATNLSLSIKWTALVFDSLSVVFIYLISKELDIFNKKNNQSVNMRDQEIRKKIIGILVAIVYIFMPLNLFYFDAYLLNGYQMIFYTLVAIFFFIKEKYKISALTFSIAWLSKQIPLFVIIVFFFILWKKEGKQKTMKQFFFPIVLWSIIFSIPWIFITPLLYLGRIFGAGRPQLHFMTENPDMLSLTIAHSLEALGLRMFAQVYYYINIPMIPFLIALFGACIIAYTHGKQIIRNNEQLLLFTTWLLFLIHALISRGIYKYYSTFFNPFLLLLGVLIIYRRIFLKQQKDKLIVGEQSIIRVRVLKNILCVFLLIILTASIYLFNIIVLVIPRMYHPLLIFCGFIFFSISLGISNPSYFRDLFKKHTYKDFWKECIKPFFKSREILIEYAQERIQSISRLFKSKNKKKQEP